MRNLEIRNVVEANQIGIKDLVKSSLCRLKEAQRLYPNVIMDVVKTGKLSRQIDLSEAEILGNSRIDPRSPLSQMAGAYFFNEEIIGGTREKQSVSDVNESGSKIVGSRWQKQEKKLKLGPGVGLIAAPTLYKDSIEFGIADSELSLNYTAPFGNLEARRGIKDIMDSRIDPEGNFFPDSGVFITDGATEGIDLFMEALAKISPQSRAVFLGLSYYTGPYSAFQKDLKVERLVANPNQPEGEQKFFPSAAEIERSLPIDTKALVLTIPNNPNGETYGDLELTKIVNLAKRRNLYILFDAIFENLYFDESQNYRSRLLQIAAESGTLDRIVVVDSLSKTKNFAGERVGFMATTDKKMTDALENIVLSRRCNPRLPLGPILRFEGLARKTKALLNNSPNLPIDSVIDYVLKQENNPIGRLEFKKKYNNWDIWNNETLKYYQDNLKLVKALLGKTAIGWSPDKAAFNTFIEVIPPGADINSMDFLAKLMYTLATYTQVGPCFGLSQQVWDQKLGVWSRITYASSREDLVEAVTRLVAFTKFYGEKNFGDSKKFPVLNIRFNDQI